MRASNKTKRAGARTRKGSASRERPRQRKPTAKRKLPSKVRAAAAPKRRAGASAGVVSPASAPTAAASRGIELEAAVLRRLLRHFDERKDVQNIELMILAGFCRNCLSKWFVEAAQERGLEVDIEAARAKIYGMPYAEWKERHQQPATEDQLRRFGEAERRGKQGKAAGV